MMKYMKVREARAKGASNGALETLASTERQQFSQSIKNGITADTVEDMYKKAHAAIRKDPERQAKAAKDVQKKRFGAKRLTHAERKAKVAKTKEEFLAQIEAQRD